MASECTGCGLSTDEWPMHSHQWIEGTDTVYCREIGGQFEVKKPAEAPPVLAHDDTKGRWWGKQYCPHPGEPCIDGCYFCGRHVGSVMGDHNHTKVNLRDEPEEYSCVCEAC